MAPELRDDPQHAAVSPPREPTAEQAPERRHGRLRYAGRAAVVTLTLGFLALLAYGLMAQAPNATIDDTLSSSRAAPAPGFALRVLEEGTWPSGLERRLAPAFADGEVDLRELRGTPVVLNFWASWCIPCREEAPVLQRAWQREGRRGVLFLGLNMQDITQDAQDFIQGFGHTFPSVRDPGRSVARTWGVTGLPETFFIDGRGRVVGHVIGVVSPSQLSGGIQAERTGRVVGGERGGARRPTR